MDAEGSSDGAGRRHSNGSSSSSSSSAVADARTAAAEEEEEPGKSKASRSRWRRRRSQPLEPYVPPFAQGSRPYQCDCGCSCSPKEHWPVERKLSKCAGLIVAVTVAGAESESEDEAGEKMERFETEKQKYEFRVHHGFEDEGYRLGPR